MHPPEHSALGEPEQLGINFFNDILPLVEQRYHDRFPQREALRRPNSLIPGIGQDIFDTRLKFIESLGIQSEGTMVTNGSSIGERFGSHLLSTDAGSRCLRRAVPKLEVD